MMLLSPEQFARLTEYASCKFPSFLICPLKLETDRYALIDQEPEKVFKHNYVVLDSNRRLDEMLVEFQPDGMFFRYLHQDLQVN